MKPKKQMNESNDHFLFRFWPVMFVLLSGSQQLLDILGDLLGFADDVLCAGKRGVWLHLQVIQLRDRAALPEPATAPQPRSPAQTAEGNSEEIVSTAKKIPAHLNCIQESENRLIVFPSSVSTKASFWAMLLPRIIHLRVIECVVIVTFRHAALLL